MTDTPSVLLVEDDADVRLGCRQALELEGIAVVAVDSAEAALRRLESVNPATVVTDIRLPGQDGLSLMRHLRETDAELPVVLMTGHGDVAMAVEAMKAGAADFIEKPFAPDHLVLVVRKALEHRRIVTELRGLRTQLAERSGIEARILGESPAIRRLRHVVADLAGTSADILIEGETGTGKDLVARCLHDTSPRRQRQYVAINCGGLPETLFESELFGHEPGAFTGASKRRIGRFEHAAGGTVFLDEIESMPLSLQVKLLRVLQERRIERLGSNVALPVEFRVIAATKADLGQLGHEGRFRSDLYYRLNVAVLRMPPLRERRDDIPVLFEHFAMEAAHRHARPPLNHDPRRLQLLLAHHWPGNVRELRNVAERCVLGIEAGFPPFGNNAPQTVRPLAATVEAFERALLADALARNAGSLARTADALQIAKTTLHDKLRKHGLPLG